MSLTATSPMPRWQSAALWIVKGLLVVAFVVAGCAKLYGVPMLVGNFARIGVGQWFRYVTGVLEIVGAVLLVMPGRAALGALLLACIMVGAVITHLFIIGGSPVPALILLVLAAVVLAAHRRQVSNFLDNQ